MGQITVKFRVVELGDRNDRSADGRQDDGLDTAEKPPMNPAVSWDAAPMNLTYPLPTATTPVNDADEGFLLRFLWWSIVGDATFDQAVFSPPSTDPSHQPWIHVGNTSIVTNANQGRVNVGTSGGDITATAWYIEDDGSVSGLLIDAFNADIGELSNAPFVTVKPDDAAHSRTHTANELGTVDTKELTVIEAFDKLSHVVPFVAWEVVAAHGVAVKKFPGVAASQAGEWLEAQPKSSGVALALYQSPSQTTVPDVLGMNSTEAKTALEGSRLNLGAEKVKVVLVDAEPFVPPVFGVPPLNEEGDDDKDPSSDFGPAGEALVTQQSPQAGTVVPTWSTVNLTLTRKRFEKPSADGPAT